MSFSLSRDRGAFEWASNDLWSLFCQSSNLYVIIAPIVLLFPNDTTLTDRNDQLQAKGVPYDVGYFPIPRFRQGSSF